MKKQFSQDPAVDRAFGLVEELNPPSPGLDWLLWKYFDSYKKGSVAFKVVFPNGKHYQNYPGRTPDLTLTFKNKRAELNAIINGDLGLLESYMNQSIDIDGPIGLLLRIDDENSPSLGKVNDTRYISHPIGRLRTMWHNLTHSNENIEQAIENAHFHYNQGTEFFRNYLDPSMTYTCAYWDEGTTTLAQAQKNKLDLVCKKLLLQKGDTLIDVGSGWGSLLFHAHEHYGALGTNYSPTPDQNRAMQKEIERRGLTGKIRIVEKDFRQVEERTLPEERKFDKYASLGVYEHAGKGQLRDWIQSMAECLKDGGIGVLHYISHDTQRPTHPFILKHVFPGGYLPGVSETIEIMASEGLEILHVDNLRRHYGKTLDCWAANFDKNWEKIQKIDPTYFDEGFRRRWHAYLHLCAESFRGEKSPQRLYQLTFSKGNTTTYPMTMRHIQMGNP